MTTNHRPSTVFIVNPQANGGRAGAWLPELRRAALALGVHGVWHLTRGPEDAVTLAREAAQQGADRVIAMGGDGTVNEVVNGLMQVPAEARPVFGVVPVGAGNDFAFASGYPEHPVAALRQALLAEPKPVDVAWVRDDRGRRRAWVNTLGIGFDAVVNLRARRLRHLRGFWRYLAAVMQTLWRNHTAMPLQLTLDGRPEAWEALMLVLCNGPREGGAFLVAPQARNDDGYLEYAGIPMVSRFTLLYLVGLVMKGKHTRHPKVRFARFRRLEVRSEAPMYVHMDGEVYADFTQPVHWMQVDIAPAALTVAREMPASTPKGEAP